jgi:hypothetical protein
MNVHLHMCIYVNVHMCMYVNVHVHMFVRHVTHPKGGAILPFPEPRQDGTCLPQNAQHNPSNLPPYAAVRTRPLANAR